MTKQDSGRPEDNKKQPLRVESTEPMILMSASIYGGAEDPNAILAEQAAEQAEAENVAADVNTGNQNVGQSEQDVVGGDKFGDEFLLGGSGNDQILGGEGDDLLKGGSGDDVLAGEAGYDLLKGGDGNDALLGGAGDDILKGGDGNDALRGGIGSDVIDGGAGFDTAVFELNSTDYQVTSIGDGQFQVAGPEGTDIVSNIENFKFADREVSVAELLGGNADDVQQDAAKAAAADADVGQDAKQVQGLAVKAEAPAQQVEGATLTGTAGGDHLHGAGGDDVLSGGEGADLLIGGAGNDTIDGGAGVDTAVFTGNLDQFQFTNLGNGSIQVVGPDGTDTLTSVERFQFNDQIVEVGNLQTTEPAPQANINSLAGQAGSVQNFGGGQAGYSTATKGVDATGFEVINLDAAGNVQVASPSAGYNVGQPAVAPAPAVQAPADVGPAPEPAPPVQNVQAVSPQPPIVEPIVVNPTVSVQAPAPAEPAPELAPPIKVEAVPTEAPVAPQVQNDNNVLEGGAGNDTIVGGQGDDRIDGGVGGDILIGNDGDDLITGGNGGDSLAGNGGDDLLDGGAGNDALDGGAGNDKLIGGTEDDVLNGGAGNDVLKGKSGNDVLEGGAGNDIIDGGAGNDVAVFNGNFNQFRITQLDNGSLQIVGPDGSDVVTGAETLRFTDQVVSVTQLQGGQDQVEPPANDAPVAKDDAFETNKNETVAGDASLNDADPNNDSLTFKVLEGPDNGTVEFNADGTFKFTPNAGFVGTETFQYQVDDGNGGTAFATITVTVSDPNTNPDAVDDAFKVNENDVLKGNLLENDVDADGDDLSIKLVQQPKNGDVTIAADGSFKFTPKPGFIGVDNFVYVVDDGNGGTDRATATVNVVDVEFDTKHEGIGGKHFGDPHFVGDDGGKFDVQGRDGGIYNIISDQNLQYNAKFKAFPIPGATVVGEIGITSGADKIQFEASSHPVINGQSIKPGQTVALEDGTATFDGRTFTVKTSEYEMEYFTRSSRGVTFIDANYKALNPFASDQVAAHGIFGQTIDADTEARSGDKGSGAQGGGAIDTVNDMGHIVRSQAGDKQSIDLYEVEDLFSTEAKNDKGSVFFRFGAAAGTGLEAIGNNAVADGGVRVDNVQQGVGNAVEAGNADADVAADTPANADDGNADDGNADDGNADDGNADDGNGAGDAPAAEPADPVRDTSNDDVLIGNDNKNFIDGKDGNDKIAGGDGRDTLKGGAGDDIIIGDDDGRDQDKLFGEGGDDKLVAGQNDIADGGAGDDTIIVKDGGVKADGGSGNDTLDLSNLKGDGRASRIDVTGGHATIGHDRISFSNVEAIVGSQGDDVFTFAKAANGDSFSIDGGSGTNTLDLSKIRAENATITDGKIEVDGEVRVREGHRTVTKNIQFEIDFENIQQIKFAGDTVVSTDNLATAGNDKLEALSNKGAHGRFTAGFVDGGAGNDNITGGKGADTLKGGAGNDVIDGSNDGRTRDQLFGNAGDDKLIAGQNDIASGGDGNDRIVATDGNVKADGGRGTDTLDLSKLEGDRNRASTIDVTGGVARAGHDVVRFESIERIVGTQGDDNFTFNGAKDGDRFTIDGGKGNNTLDLSRIKPENVTVSDGKIVVEQPEVRDGHGAKRADGVKFEISFNNVDQIKLAGDVRLSTDSFATDGNDKLEAFSVKGNHGRQTAGFVDGGAGNDQITGSKGADRLSGGAGNDVIDSSNDGRVGDKVDGGAGNDRLIAGANDRIDGGAGNDKLDLSNLKGDANRVSQINVTGGVAQIGHNQVRFENVEAIVGTDGNDNFSFNGAKNGDSFTIDGGKGQNSIDLSRIAPENIHISGNQINVDQAAMRDGHGAVRTAAAKFSINFDNIDTIRTAGGQEITLNAVAGIGNVDSAKASQLFNKYVGGQH